MILNGLIPQDLFEVALLYTLVSCPDVGDYIFKALNTLLDFKPDIKARDICGETSLNVLQSNYGRGFREVSQVNETQPQ